MDKVKKMKETMKEKKKRFDAFRAMGITCMMTIMMELFEDKAYAAGELENGINNALDSAYTTILGIVGVVYGFAIVIGAFRIYISSGREVEQIWGYIKRCTAAFLIILMAAWIVNFIKGLVSGAPTHLK